jgi:hypothetical protein
MKIAFRHMEHEKNKLDWQGAQVGYVGFDEITHFTESMVTYMFSRGRSKSGVSAYFRGTCNPDPTRGYAAGSTGGSDPMVCR